MRHFPREYVLVKQTTLSSLGFLHACLRSEDSAKAPRIKESETVVLVLLLMEFGAYCRVGWVAIAKSYVE